MIDKKNLFSGWSEKRFFLLYVESNQYMKPIHVVPISHDLSATELHPKFEFTKPIHVVLTTHNLSGCGTTLKISIYPAYTRTSGPPEGFILLQSTTSHHTTVLPLLSRQSLQVFLYPVFPESI